MLFNSYVFLFVFLPLVLIGWWALPSKKLRLLFLTLSSCVFYGWWDYRFIPLMVVSAGADFIAGQLIRGSPTRARKTLWLVLLLCFNLGMLAVFKYFDFVTTTLNQIAALAGTTRRLPLLGLVLPVGISFYTFNSISYTIDVYRERTQPAKGLLEFSSFVVMFPHLIAGPIVRYADMGEQFDNLPTRPRSGEIVMGAWFFVLGLAKKTLVADLLASHFVTPLFDHPGDLRLLGGWLATLAYTFQIYFDFSGYSDMAVGLAFFLGLRFPQNFDSPYKAANIAEFWRRWHMSLSFWLRDYLFIPLGGSRGTLLETTRNLAITMFLGGLWHGASWTFVLWGLYHGVLLAAHAAAKQRGLVPKSHALAVAITFFAVMVGWVLFRAPTLHAATSVLSAMAGLRGVEPLGEMLRMTANKGSAIMLFAGVLSFFAPNTWELNYPRRWWAAVLLGGLLLLCTLRFANPSPFLYFQF